MSAVSAQEAWAVGDFGVLLHTRDGVAWEQQPLPAEIFGDENPPERILNSVHFPSSQRGFIAGEFGTLLRTSDHPDRELQFVAQVPAFAKTG